MAKLLYEKKDGIGWVRFNRPEVLNAITGEEVARLVEVLGEASQDKEVRAVIISSVGKAFCAGDDLREMAEEFEDIESGKRTIIDIIETITEDLQEVARLTRGAPKVIIAATRGYAVGAGCEIAIDCDLIVAAEDTKFGFPELTAAMSITGGVTKLLPMTIGLAKAREMCYTGEFIDAQEAYRLGLVNKVVPVGEEEKAAEEMARLIMSRSPLAVIAHKRLINQSVEVDLETALNLEKQTIGVLLASRDAVEGAKAFVAKRKPRFTGR